MSKDDFSIDEFNTRHQHVRKEMAARGIELLVVIAPTNIQYLIGSRTKSYQEFQCLLFPLDPKKPKVVLARLAEVPEYTDLSLADAVHGWGGREPEDPISALKGLIERYGYMRDRVGFEVPYYYLSVGDHAKLRTLFANNNPVEASDLVENIKLVKSPEEIAFIRKACAITLKTMQVAAKAMRVGVTEREVAGEVYRSLLVEGGDLPASPANFVTGERTCYAHGAPTDRRLQEGDFINLEFGAAYNRYCTTIGRQFVLGEPTARMVELYDAAKRATDACIEKMHVGVAAVEAHRAAKQALFELGFDRYRLHTTGYGIAPGYPPSWGESIHLFEDSQHILKAGMMLSVEPPIYIHEERLGVRIIDNILITDSGPELLTTYDRDLIVLPI